jgi:hypothetical protein
MILHCENLEPAMSQLGLKGYLIELPRFLSIFRQLIQQ